MPDVCAEGRAIRDVRTTRSEATRAQRDLALSRRASRQQGLVSPADLRALSIDKHGVARRVASGRLHRVFGVFALGHTALSRHARRLAATLTYGPGAAISHETAGHDWGWILNSGAVIDVTVSAGRGRTRHEGLRVHRTRRLRHFEIVIRDGVPTTSPARTLVDLAALMPIDRALHLALAAKLVEANALRRYLAGAGRRPGVASLRRALDDTHPEVHRTRSELERIALRLIDEAGLPRPRVNHLRSAHEVDLA